MSPTTRSKLQERTCQLQSAIRHIGSVRKILCNNSQEIKSQIQGNISRQLEALRNREVWLLNQVDLLQSAKEDVLRNQQAQLDTALGSANKTLQIMFDGDYDIDDCDESIDADALKPAETPHLLFQANSVGLREKILAYGKIETAGFPDRSIFMNRHDSASLPKAWEDNEDDEHHMLYKTVPRGPASVSLPGSFRRARPNTAPVTPVTATATPWLAPSASRPAMPTSTVSTDLSTWLNQPRAPRESTTIPHASSNASICSWLQELKTSPHMEEDDEFDIIDAVMSPTAKDKSCGFLTTQTASVPQRKVANHASLFIKTLLAQDIAKWLKGDNSYSRHQKREPAMPSAKLDGVAEYYRILRAQSNAKWLIKSGTEAKTGGSVMIGAGQINTSVNGEGKFDYVHKAIGRKQKENNERWIKQENHRVSKMSSPRMAFDKLRLFHKECAWLCNGHVVNIDADQTAGLVSSQRVASPSGSTRSGDDESQRSSIGSSVSVCSANDDGQSSSIDVMSDCCSYDEWLSMPSHPNVPTQTNNRNNLVAILKSEVNTWLLKT